MGALGTTTGIVGMITHRRLLFMTVPTKSGMNIVQVNSPAISYSTAIKAIRNQNRTATPCTFVQDASKASSNGRNANITFMASANGKVPTRPVLMTKRP